MTSKAIAERKKACGYVPATLRQDNCAGCRFVTYEFRDPDTPHERRVMFCRPHSLPVTVGSKCNDWEAKP